MGNTIGNLVGGIGSSIGGALKSLPQGLGAAPGRVSANSYQYGGTKDMLNQLQSVWNLGQIANLPADTAINNNISSYMQQLGLIGANQQMETGNINQDQALGSARLGLNRSDLNLQQAALGRQDTLDPRLHQLSLEELQQQGQQNQFGADQQNRQLTSQGVTQGALQSVGARQGFSDIAQQLQFGQRDVLRGTQRENLGFEERQAQRADQHKSLENAAKGLDLDAQELQNRTSRALQQLGLSSALSVQDVTRAINDLNAGRYNPLQAILGTIYQASGVRPVAGGK